MDENRENVNTPLEEESDFSYLAKLSEAYKRTQTERRKLDLNEEKRAYLTEMQRELAAIGHALLSYFEREEKKELAVYLYKNAEGVLRAIGEEGAITPTPQIPPFPRAVLLANRSLDALCGAGGYGDLTRMILSELSAIYALAVMG